MAFFKTKDISIAGVSTAVPVNEVNVDSYVPNFGDDVVRKFKKKTGILHMHRTENNQTASDLGFAAAENLFNKLGIDKSEIGVLIFVSQSPDYRKPATACVLQYRLGLSNNCAAFDVGLGCSGFLYGHQIMQSFLSSSDARYGLLIVAETSSKQANNNDKTIGMMFGDAGSAILYERKESDEIATLLETDGSRYKSIIVPAGGFRDLNPVETEYVTPDGAVRSKFDAYMDGLAVFEFSITDIPMALDKYLNHIGKKADDFDYVVLHQANTMIIKQIAKKLGVTMDKVPLSLDIYGNTSGVSIPITLCKAFGECESGMVNILASGFGIGLSLGVTSFYVDVENILPVITTDVCFTEGLF